MDRRNRRWIFALSGAVVLGLALVLAGVLRRDDGARAGISAGDRATPGSEAREPGPTEDRGASARTSFDGPSSEEHARVSLEPATQAELRAQPLRLELVERDSKRPLAHFAIRVEGADGVVERLESDAQGRVESASAYLPGTIAVVALDQPECAPARDAGVEIEHPGPSEPTAVPIACGPTYRLQLTAPGPIVAGDLRAELRPRGYPAAPEDRECARFPVHADRQGLWTRVALARVERPLDAQGWTLVIDDARRAWFGAADVQQAVAGGIEDVALELTAGLSWSGSVFDPTGHAIEGARASLKPLDDRQRTAPERARTQSDGSFSISGVVPGVYGVSVRAEGFLPHHDRLEVGPGSPPQAHIVLERASFGDLHGVVLGYRPSDQRRVRANLFPRGPVGSTLSVELEPFDDGDAGPLGAFSFQNVPIAEYRLSISGLPPGSIEPESLSVQPPRSDLEFRVLDLGPTTDFGFFVRDSATQSAIEAHSSWFDALDGRSLAKSSEAQDGAVTLRDWPERVPFTWIVAAHGYRPAWGASSAFGELSARGRFARIELTAGWGTRVRVLGRAGPISGAAILLDDLEAGTTDAEGIAWVASAQPPASIEVRREGFAAARLDVPADSLGNQAPGFGWVVELKAE